MCKRYLLLLAIALCAGCGAVWPGSDVRDIKVDKNYYATVVYPHTIEELQRNITKYKSRCGTFSTLTSDSLSFDMLDDNNAFLKVDFERVGTIVVVNAVQAGDETTLTVWVPASYSYWSYAEYMFVVVEDGMCIDSLRSNTLKNNHKLRLAK